MEQNRKPRTDSYNYAQLIFDKRAKATKWRMDVIFFFPKDFSWVWQYYLGFCEQRLSSPAISLSPSSKRYLSYIHLVWDEAGLLTKSKGTELG